MCLESGRTAGSSWAAVVGGCSWRLPGRKRAARQGSRDGSAEGHGGRGRELTDKQRGRGSITSGLAFLEFWRFNLDEKSRGAPVPLRGWRRRTVLCQSPSCLPVWDRLGPHEGAYSRLSLRSFSPLSDWTYSGNSRATIGCSWLHCHRHSHGPSPTRLVDFPALSDAMFSRHNPQLSHRPTAVMPWSAAFFSRVYPNPGHPLSPFGHSQRRRPSNHSTGQNEVPIPVIVGRGPASSPSTRPAVTAS
jgi:hypothetical protein